MCVVDRTQMRHALRRNFPLPARVRYLFGKLGEYFRRYFSAMDEYRLPLNRAQRNWVYPAAMEPDTTVAFGSTRDLRPTGTMLFVNCSCLTLERDALKCQVICVGPMPSVFLPRQLFSIVLA